MRTSGTWLAVIAVTMLSACGEAPSPPATPVAALTPTPAPAAPPTAPGVAGPIAQETKAIGQAVAKVLAPARPSYQVRGRRDPFENLELRVQEREASAPNTSATSIVAASKLTGVVRGPGAMLALVETAQGMGYILKTGDTLGDGRVVEISTDQVVFSVPPKPGSAANRVVLKIAKD